MMMMMMIIKYYDNYIIYSLKSFLLNFISSLDTWS